MRDHDRDPDGPELDDPVDDPIALAPPEPEPAADPLAVVATADVGPADGVEPEAAERVEPVRARWVDSQPTFNPEHGIVQYGEEIYVSPEQLDDPNTRAIAWDDNWQPDPATQALVPVPAGEEG